MSGGNVCRCEESKKPIRERRWHVYQRFCNHSAFNGYRMARSDYSSIGCAACHMTWRTKAGYVHSLPDYKVDV